MDQDHPSPTGRVSALCAALRVLDGAGGMDATLAQCLRSARELVDFDAGVAAVCDRDAGEVLTTSHGLPAVGEQAVVAAVVASCTEEPPAVRQTQAQVTTLAGGPPAEAAAALLGQALGLARVCRVPLTLDGKSAGVLLLGARSGQAFDAEDVAVLEALGAHAAALVSQGLVARAADRAGLLQQKLLEVSVALNAGNDIHAILDLIAHTALDVAEGQCCCVQTVDDEQHRLERVCVAPQGTPCDLGDDLQADAPAWRAVESEEVVIAATGEGSGAGPTIAVPMTTDASPIGVLRVRRRSGVGFSFHEMSGLRLLAAQAAVAIHNAHLYEVARRRSQHMEVIAEQAWQEEAKARALFEIATAVTEKTQLQEILADVTRSACAEIGFERARIYLADHEHRLLRGQLEARANSAPQPIRGEDVPLSREGNNPLAEAALGSADYMIDTVAEPVGDSGVRGYERLCMPLTTQNALVGLIVADNPDTGRPVSPQRTRLLHSLAGLASVAIERARVDKLRETLISAVSHELRAPLASVRAYNELVMDGDAGEVNDEQRLYLGRVERACKRLEHVIADLMSLSKLRSGEVAITKAPADLANLVQAVVDTMAPKAKEAGVVLEAEPAADLPLAMTDQSRVEQVVTNLVDNAIKFNERGGWVRVQVSLSGTNALIAVADNGPGIPRAHLPLIFEEFHHGTDERSRAKEGAGLGLAIASRITGMLGGKLWVESELGEGSTFYVSVPI